MTALPKSIGLWHSRAALTAALALSALACGGSEKGGGASDAGTFAEARVLPDPDGGESDAGQPELEADAGGPDGFDAGAPADGGTSLTVKSVSPSRGSVDGGMAVTLLGTGFFRSFASGATDAAARTRLFIGGREAAGLSVINDLRLEALAPSAESAGTADVVLENPSGEARCEGCFTYFVPLSLGALSPSFGSASGGEWTALSGRGFTQGMQVYFGGVRSPEARVSGDGEALAMTPAMSSPGTASVVAVGEGGIAQAPQGFVFEAPMAIDAAEPRVVPLAGNVEVRLTGTALLKADALLVDGAPAAFSVDGGGTLSFIAPGRALPGTASVVVLDAAGREAALEGGLTWAGEAPSGSEDEAPFVLLGAFPAWAAPEGGTRITVTGAGLDEALSLLVNGAEVPPSQILGRTPETLTFFAPPGSPGALAEVTLADAEGRPRTLAGAFRYRLLARSVSPQRGSAGDVVTLEGEGFREGASYAVRFGTLSSEVTGSDGRRLSVPVPPGLGTVDVTAEESGAPASGSTLKAAFTYVEPLSLFAVSPSSGTVAGGDEVTVFGAGFAPGLSVRVGEASLKDVALVDASRLCGRVPAGSAGSADVSVSLGGASVVLPGGYAYRDSAASIGGSSGGALAGTLSVTVFRSSAVRIPGVRAEVFADGELLAAGTTDESGQASLQSPKLNRPVRVVFRKDGYRTLAVEAQASGHLSVYLTQLASAASSSSSSPGTQGSAGSVSSGGTEASAGDLPQGSTAAGGGTMEPDYTSGTEAPVLSGTVSGFKLPRELAPGEIAMAEVFAASPSYLSLPPFSSSASDQVRDLTGERWRVTSDGGPFTIYGSQGQQTLYALFGIYDTAALRLTPSLMGIARSVSALPSSPGAGVEILLDMHLSAELEAVVEDPDAASPDAPLNSLYAWLSLGSDGYIAFGPAVGYGPLKLTGLPHLSADNFIFLNRSSSADGASSGYCFRRTQGSLSDGLSLGPMVGQSKAEVPEASESVIVTDAASGERTRVFAFDGVIRWRHVHGTAPDIQRLNVKIVHGDDGTAEFLEAVMPGTQTSWEIGSLTQRPVDPALDEVTVTYESNRAPRFDYDFWSYSHFSTSSLSCWTIGTFQVPLREVVLDDLGDGDAPDAGP